METELNKQPSYDYPDLEEDVSPLHFNFDEAIDSAFQMPSTSNLSHEAKEDLRNKIKDIFGLVRQQYAQGTIKYREAISIVATERENLNYEILSLREENDQLNEMSINLISQVGKLKKYLDDSDMLISLLRGENSHIRRENKKLTQGLQDAIDGDKDSAVKLLNEIQNKANNQPEDINTNFRKSYAQPKKIRSLFRDDLRFTSLAQVPVEEEPNNLSNDGEEENQGEGDGEDKSDKKKDIGVDTNNLYFGKQMRNFQTFPASFGRISSLMNDTASASNQEGEEPPNSTVTGEEDVGGDDLKDITSVLRMDFNDNLAESQFIQRKNVSLTRGTLDANSSNLDNNAVNKETQNSHNTLNMSQSLSKSPFEVDTARRSRVQRISDLTRSVSITKPQVFKKSDRYSIEPQLSEQEGMESYVSPSKSIKAQYLGYELVEDPKMIATVSRETQTDNHLDSQANKGLRNSNKDNSLLKRGVPAVLALGGIALAIHLLGKEKLVRLTKVFFKQNMRS